MQWLLDHLQVVALVVLAVVSLFKSMLDAKGAANKDKPGELEPADDEAWPERPPPLPPVTQPPLRQKTSKASQSRPKRESAVFEPSAEQAAMLQRQQDLQNQLQQLKEQRKPAAVAGGAAATNARALAAAQRGGGKAAPLPTKKVGLKASLRRRSEIRRAVVMREILGPPVGLR